MLAVVPLFVSGMADKVAAFAVKSLAVAGGFLAGYVIGGVAAAALDRWVFARKTPDVIKRAVRILTGAAAALLVALVVFGDGSGGGLFGGGGGPDGLGKGTNQDTQTGDKSQTPTTPPNVKVGPKADPSQSPAPPGTPTVRVTFLGGDAVRGDRFYLLDDDPNPKTFDELKAAILERKMATSGPLLLLVQFPADPRQRIDESSINVTQVTSWARNTAGVEVVWPRK